MKNIKIILTALLTTCLVTLNAMDGYYPIKITNNASKSKNVTNTYIMIIAKDLTKQANSCVVKLTYDSKRKAQVASLVRITSTTNPRLYSYPIDSLQGYDAASSSITIYIPHLQSGRCMFSMNYPLYMPPIQAADKTWALQDPSVGNISDVNYDIVYDKFEFSYDTTGTSGCFYINPTAVDFFSIPITLVCDSQSSGNIAGLKRDFIVKSITDTVTKYDNSSNKTWSSLIIKDKSKQTTIRVTSPSLAPGFDSTYLQKIKYNYIDTLINYYSNNSVYINCTELNESGMQIFDTYSVTPSQDIGAYFFKGKLDLSNNMWIFTNSPKSPRLPIIDTIRMGYVKTGNFFGPGTTPFDTPNKTVKSIVVKNITSAFTVNMLPAKNGDTLQKKFYNKNLFYKLNTRQNSPINSGPWYNLYTRAVHGAIPIIYAFAYDDVLGQDGTITTRDTTKTIKITIGNLGNMIIPKHDNNIPVFAVNKIKYNSGFVPINPGSTILVDTVIWENPINQPINAKYFLIPNGKGAPYSATIDSIIYFQQQKGFYSYNDTMGVLKINSSSLGSPCPKGIYMQVMTCGGPGCPSNGRPSLLDSCAVGSNPKAPKDSCSQQVFPVTPLTNTGFNFNNVASNGDSIYKCTVTWSVPSNQPYNAKYFISLIGDTTYSKFSIPIDSFISKQIGSFASYKATTTSIFISKSELGSSYPDSLIIQVLTCGGPGCPCVTQSTINSWGCSPGSNPLKPNVKKALKTRRVKCKFFKNK